MKRKLLPAALLLCLLSLLFCVSASAANTASGTCGTSLNWTLSTDGVLSITGTGAMTNYNASFLDGSSSAAPWYGYAASVKKIRVSSGVTTLGSYAFEGLYNAASISLPATLKTISAAAFINCSSLTTITIPKGVTSIITTVNPFSGCTHLKKISVSAYNTAFCSVDGVLYNRSRTKLICYPSARSANMYTILKSTRTLAYESFRDCSALKSVSIPSSVKTIEDFSFSACNLADSTAFTVNFLGDLPSLGSNTFSTSYNVSAYYPSGNTTWVSGALRSYGGSVTWTAGGSKLFESEPNDTKSDASGISASIAVSGTLSSSADLDYYRVSVPDSGFVTLKLTHASNGKSQRYYKIQLLTAGGGTVFTGYVSGKNTSYASARIGLPKGTYFIRVSGYNGNYIGTEYQLTAAYSHTTSYETEPNSKASTADKLTIGSAIYGSVMSSSDKDYYKVTASAGRYKLRLSHAASSNSKTCYTVTVYDASLKKVASFTNKGTKKSSVKSLTLGKGTYYIVVEDGASRIDERYSLLLSAA